MTNNVTFRLLEPKDIDVRAAQCVQRKDGTACACLLLYKDARVDQSILDETFGIFGWQRSHQLIGDRLYCTISVKNPETGEWISKQDVGTESNTEKEKGQASDSFKRACFNLGIGRELYSAPRIWVELNDKEFDKSAQGRIALKTFTTFSVKSIEYNDRREVVGLVLVDSKGNERYRFGSGKPAPQKKAPKAETAPEVVDGKRKLTDAQFEKYMARLNAGEKLYDKLVQTFAFDEEQMQILNQYK